MTLGEICPKFEFLIGMNIGLGNQESLDSLGANHRSYTFCLAGNQVNLE
jgi:hypothetical protein